MEKNINCDVIKKRKLSVTISTEVNNQLNDLNVNKSKLINWLLQEFFNNNEL